MWQLTFFPIRPHTSHTVNFKSTKQSQDNNLNGHLSGHCIIYSGVYPLVRQAKNKRPAERMTYSLALTHVYTEAEVIIVVEMFANRVQGCHSKLR